MLRACMNVHPAHVDLAMVERLMGLEYSFFPKQLPKDRAYWAMGRR